MNPARLSVNVCLRVLRGDVGAEEKEENISVLFFLCQGVSFLSHQECFISLHVFGKVCSLLLVHTLFFYENRIAIRNSR